jgi:ATP-dependent Clp protease ATP-binding subunit ClpC
VFERFTERARQVMLLAQDEAHGLKHSYIGTEHLLLGLLREEQGLGARVLAALDVTLVDVRAQVVRIVGEGHDVTTGQIPFTPSAKKVLELALREGLSLKHDYIGTEHILLGLVRVDEGVASQILNDLGADPERVRTEVIRLLSGSGVPPYVASAYIAGVTPPGPSLSIRPTHRRLVSPPAMLLAGGLLFGLALGVGILVGWAIWG